MSFYSPSDDSLFFAEFLKDYFSKLSKNEKQNIKYLDMGTGSAILSEIALKSGIKKENITAADINKEAVKEALNKGFNSIQSDFFLSLELKNKKFDIITFNAPYLPNNKFDKQKDISGGKTGDEASLKFLKQAKKHLSKCGKIFLLISSLTPKDKIFIQTPKIKATKKIFFEELFILEFS